MSSFAASSCSFSYFLLNSDIILPPRSSHWNFEAPLTFPSVVTPLDTPSNSFSFTHSITPSPYVLEAFVAKAPWISKPQPCPVNSRNRDAWTELERSKAGHRVVAKSLDHLQELVFLSLLHDFLHFLTISSL